MKTLAFFVHLVAWFGLVFCSPVHAQAVTPEEARAVAKEAYIWGYALVDDFRIYHAYFVDKENPEFKGGWNTIGNNTRLYTPEDTTIQSINAARSTRLSESICARSRSWSRCPRSRGRATMGAASSTSGDTSRCSARARPATTQRAF